MKNFKNTKVIKAGLAFVLLGFLFASVPFFEIIHAHTYTNEHSEIVQLKDYEGKCCNPIKIQSNLQGILLSEVFVITLSFTNDYNINKYNYLFFAHLVLNNKAPPLNLTV